MRRCQYEVTDDSGLLALVDLAGYRSFVGADCSPKQLLRHLGAEVERGCLAIWGTGREDVWRVEVRFGRSPEPGFREFTTLLRASSEHLLLTNYESLDMAASYEGAVLPERHQEDLRIAVVSGLYSCRIVQRFDPEPYDPPCGDGGPDFLVELAPASDADERGGGVAGIPWSDTSLA